MCLFPLIDQNRDQQTFHRYLGLWELQSLCHNYSTLPLKCETCHTGRWPVTLHSHVGRDPGERNSGQVGLWGSQGTSEGWRPSVCGFPLGRAMGRWSPGRVRAGGRAGNVHSGHEAGVEATRCPHPLTAYPPRPGSSLSQQESSFPPAKALSALSPQSLASRFCKEGRPRGTPSTTTEPV